MASEHSVLRVSVDNVHNERAAPRLCCNCTRWGEDMPHQPEIGHGHSED